MNPRFKKAAILVVKIVVLAGILEYARRQSQLADEIAMPAANSPGAQILARRNAVTGSGKDVRFVLVTVDGKSVQVAPEARLPVIEAPDATGKRVAAYRVEAPSGSRIDISARDVQGSMSREAFGATSTEPAPEGAPFALLPGLRSLFDNLDFGLLGLAFAAFGPPIFLMSVRLRMLLSSSGIHVPFFTLVRLHYLGFFFNMFMPGGAGGDIVKAVYLARHCAQKAEAATLVFIDRVLGLIGLLVMAGTVVLFDYRNMHGIALPIGSLSLALTIFGVLFFSVTFRKWIRYDWVISRLPRAEVAQRVDAALLALGDRKGAVLGALALTIVLQLIEVGGVALAGEALGLYRARPAHYLVFVPIGFLTNAVPISVGGIGLMEGAFLHLFRDTGVATATQGFMLGVLTRLIILGWSLVGAISALFPPERGQVELALAAPAPVEAPAPEET